MIVLPGCSMAILLANYIFLQLNFIDVIIKLHDYLTLADSQRRVTDADQANPQCLVFSPQSSNWTVFFRDQDIYKTCILFSPNVLF